jgi:hypothetical protein
MGRVSAKGGLRRFESAEIDPTREIALPVDHPAVVGAHTLYPSTVTSTMESPRFLVSGQNNSKLGGRITKGERSGWPIYHLTLEERATCPRSCHAFRECYGNGMHLARRHAVDAEFMPALRGEVMTVARQHPEGLLLRLHTLGDFFSVEYVLMWGELLALLPQLHVFGYTARREDDADPASRKIAKAIRLLTQGAWSRFAIRTSHTDPGRERSIMVATADPDLPKVIVCPAQTHATECCGTCGLCWAPNARDKTIAFLRHGRKRRPPEQADSAAVIAAVPRHPIQPPARPASIITGTGTRDVQRAAMMAHLQAIADANGEVRDRSLPMLAEAANIAGGSALFVLRELSDMGLIEIRKGEPGPTKKPPKNVYRLIRQPVAPVTLPVEPAPKAAMPPVAAAVVVQKPKTVPRVPDNMPVNQRPERKLRAAVQVSPKPRKPPLIAASLDIAEADGAHEGPCVLTKLRPGQCHWPLENSPTGADQVYCAKPSGDEQYCPPHKARLRAKAQR